MKARVTPHLVTVLLVLLVTALAIGMAVALIRWGGMGGRPPAKEDAGPTAQGPASSSPTAERGQVAGAERPELELTGSELIGWYQGQRQWRLRARSVQVVGENSLTRLEDIREGVIYRDGQPYLGFSSAGGEWDQSNGSLRLWGGVEVSLEGRTVFATESLHWDGNTERLVVPGRAQLFWDGQELEADRLEAGVPSQTIVATGKVRVAQTGQALEAERVIIDLHTGELRAEGTAHLVLELPADG